MSSLSFASTGIPTFQFTSTITGFTFVLTGMSGPNKISGTTAIDAAIPDASTSAVKLLATDSTGLFARTVNAGAFGLSWIGAATQTAAQTLLGLGSAALHAATDFDASGTAAAVVATLLAANNTWTGSQTLAPGTGSVVPLTIVSPVVSPTANSIEWWGHATTQSARQAYITTGWSNAVFATRLPTWNLGLDTHLGTVSQAISVGFSVGYPYGASVGINGSFDQGGAAYNLTVTGSQYNNDQLLLLPYGTVYGVSKTSMGFYVDDVNGYGGSILYQDNNSSPVGFAISCYGTYNPPFQITSMGLLSLQSSQRVNIQSTGADVRIQAQANQQTLSLSTAGFTSLVVGDVNYNYSPTNIPAMAIHASLSSSSSPVLQLITDSFSNHLELFSGVANVPVRCGIISGLMTSSYAPSSYFGQMVLSVDNYSGNPQTGITITSTPSGTANVTLANVTSAGNVPLKNTANTFTATQTISAGSTAIGLQIVQPNLATGHPFSILANGNEFVYIDANQNFYTVANSIANQFISGSNTNLSASALVLGPTASMGFRATSGGSVDTQFSRSSAGLFTVSNPLTTGGSGVAGFTFSSYDSSALQTIGGVTYSWQSGAGQTDSSRLGQAVFNINSYNGSQTAITIAATSGTPTVSLSNVISAGNVALLNTANTFTAAQTITASNPVLVLNTPNSSTVPGIQFQRTGSLLWSLYSNTNNYLCFGVPGQNDSFRISTSGATSVLPQSASVVGLVIQGAASQSADVFQAQSSGSVVYSSIPKYNGTGTNNVLMGSGAGSGLTTSSGNVLIGYNAGALLTTGNGPGVIIGSGANCYTSNDNRMVAVGGNAIASGTSTAIGYGATATSSGGAPNLSIGMGTSATGTRSLSFGLGANATDRSCMFTINATPSNFNTGWFGWYSEIVNPAYILGCNSATVGSRNVGGLFGAWSNSTDSSLIGQVSVGVFSYLSQTTPQTALTVTAQSSGVPAIALAGPTTISTGTTGDVQFTINAAASPTVNVMSVQLNGIQYFTIDSGGNSNSTALQIKTAGSNTIAASFGSNSSGMKLQQNYSIKWTSGQAGVFTDSNDTQLGRASAGILNLQDPNTTGGTGVAGFTFSSYDSSTLQTLGSDTLSWSTQTDSSRLAQRVMKINSYSGANTFLTVTATASSATSVFSGTVSNPGSGSLSEAWGSGATATQTGSVSLGQNAAATSTGAIALGQSASAAGNTSVALGGSASAASSYTVALGNSSSASGSGAIAVGRSATASAGNSMAFGFGSSAGSAGQIQFYTNGNAPNVYLAYNTTGTPTQRQAAFWGGSFSTTTEGSQLGLATLGVLNVLTQQTGLSIQAATTQPNLALLSGSGSYGGGAGVIFIANDATDPTTNPTGGGILYVSGGALKYRGSSGTTTVIAAA